MKFRTFGAARAMFPDSLGGIRLPRVCYAPDDGGGSGGGGGTQTPPPAKTPASQDPDEPQGESFSRDYVRELRAENKGWRLKASEQEQARRSAEEKAAKAEEEANAKITAAQQAANDRIIRAELKAAAVKAGMVDLDGLKLADLSKVTLKDDGTVEGADDLMKALKEAKPYLFGQAAGTSHTGSPPPAKQHEAKKATEMTADEYAAAKKKLGLKK